jgi:hypothetical protein
MAQGKATADDSGGRIVSRSGGRRSTAWLGAYADGVGKGAGSADLEARVDGLAACHAVPPHPFLLVYLSERTVVPAPSPAPRRAGDNASSSHQTTLPAGSRVGYQSQFAQRRHQEQPASSLFLRVGCSESAEVFRCWRPRVGIPNFDKDSGAVARQPQADSRLVASRRSLHGVGHQLADEQFAVWGQPVQSPLPQHVPGMQPGAGHRGRQSAEFEGCADRADGGTPRSPRYDAL